MVDGYYHDGEDITQTLPSGKWERAKSDVRHWITADGAAGPTGDGGFKAETKRYHLFVAWNCPWAHRALLTRALLGLEQMISISVARPNRTEQGWVFDKGGEYSDSVLGVSALHEVYSADANAYTGRITVPVLWDKKRSKIVSNESADIVRMLNTAFRDFAPDQPDFYPARQSDEIDEWNDLIYKTLNNGVYRAGFASTQEAYEQAAHAVFQTLDHLDHHLAENRYLCGDVFSEADTRLFPTLARFDVAYHYAFRCNLRRLVDYNHLWPYAREIFQMSGVADTVRLDIYKQGYFSKSEKRNPLGIIPIGPNVDWSVPHGRS